MIEFTNASVVAPGSDARIVHSTTARLHEHRISVIGANGSGKSTLARMINGLVLPTDGTVTVHGHDTKTKAKEVRALVGFLFTDPAAQLIMPTAIEDVSLSLRRSIPDAKDRASAAQAQLESVGLGAHAHVPVHALSGGQKQLLALAGILALEPAIIVADEPTTLLDLRWRAHVNALLADFPHQVIEVTHDLDAAIRADRTLVIDEGRIAFDGSPDKAVAHYRSLMKTRHSAAG